VTNPHSWELPEEEYEVVSIPSWNQRKSKSMHLASDETAYEKLFEERVERIVVIDTCGKLKVIEGVEELKQAASLLENAKDEKLEPFWIDIQFPSAKTLECLGEIFGIHNLTIEDCLNMDDMEASEKNEVFDTYRFVVFNEVHYKPGSNVLNDIPMNIILFKTHVITTHHGPLNSFDQALLRLRQDHIRRKSILRAEWVLYALIDCSIDLFVILVKALELEVEALDNLVLILSTTEHDDLLTRIADSRNRSSFLTNELLVKRDIIRPMIEHHKAEDGTPKTEHRFHKNTKVYMRDVFDHVVGMIRDIEGLKERISSIYGTYLVKLSLESAQTANKMNVIMKIFGAIATLSMAGTFITSIFSMNVHVPGAGGTNLHWFAAIMSFIGAATLVLVVVFRRLQWL